MLLDYESEEIETKIRVESTKKKNSWTWNIGGGLQDVVYKNSTFREYVVNGEVELLNFESKINFQKYELFTQLSRAFVNDRLTLSLGIRTDANNYSDEMSNMLEQLSPRFSASYQLSEKFAASFNVGRYFQLPAYTVMGFRDNDGNLVNKENDAPVQRGQAGHLAKHHRLLHAGSPLPRPPGQFGHAFGTQQDVHVDAVVILHGLAAHRGGR